MNRKAGCMHLRLENIDSRTPNLYGCNACKTVFKITLFELSDKSKEVYRQ